MTASIIYGGMEGRGFPIQSEGGALSVHDAHVHHKAFNKFIHQHTAVSTTLSTGSSINAYEINVVDTTGFTVGSPIHINTTVTEFTHPTIRAITPGTPGILQLDRRLDFAHLLGDNITQTILNMATTGQVGSIAVPQEYWAGPAPGEIWHVNTLHLAMGHNTAGDLDAFGNLIPLLNGVVLRVRNNGQYGTLTNWKVNGDIEVDVGGVRFPDRSSGGGTYGTAADGPFLINTGAIIKLDGNTNDRFEVYIQDDITALYFFYMKLQGHFEGTWGE